MWYPHTSDCVTCSYVAKQSKGGRPKKSKGNRGRPKSVFTVEDILNLSPSKPVPKAVQQMYFTCGRDKD